mmetsp:Transcript_51010/g.150352  ORF Transcript_51010/g.150352 Transcript_51010/m.150352 type:complete len:231 (+) Transcript_51010:1-693(+)
MHWPGSKSKDKPEEAGSAAAPPGGGGGFSAPPPSEAPAPSRFSAPPEAPVPAAAPPSISKYENMDLSKYASSVYESDGLQDASLARRDAGGGGGSAPWVTHPRARQCISNIQLGAKMGASVGGCFGLLTGLYVGVTQRSILVVPLSVVGGAISFGFFLGCGMIIRCEDGKLKAIQAHAAQVQPGEVRSALHAAAMAGVQVSPWPFAREALARELLVQRRWTAPVAGCDVE